MTGGDDFQKKLEEFLNSVPAEDADRRELLRKSLSNIQSSIDDLMKELETTRNQLRSSDESHRRLSEEVIGACENRERIERETHTQFFAALEHHNELLARIAKAFA